MSVAPRIRRRTPPVPRLHPGSSCCGSVPCWDLNGLADRVALPVRQSSSNRAVHARLTRSVWYAPISATSTTPRASRLPRSTQYFQQFFIGWWYANILSSYVRCRSLAEMAGGIGDSHALNYVGVYSMTRLAETKLPRGESFRVRTVGIGWTLVHGMLIDVS